MKWLITGGCGFIGTNLVLRLLNLGEQVLILDNLSARGIPRALKDLPRSSAGDLTFDGESSILPGDVRDAELAMKAGANADVIVHLAACTGVLPSLENPRYDCDVNILGTLNLLESARRNRCKAFIFASSGAPLGQQFPPVHEGMAPKPASPYGASKLAGEGYCSAYHQSFDLRTIILRFSNVYGPHCLHKESVIALFIKRALSGQPLIIYGDGAQTRDFVHVEDLITAILMSVEKAEGGEIYQIGSQTETSISGLTRIIQEAIPRRVSSNVVVQHESTRKGEIVRNYTDTSKARKVLGWKAKWELKSGIHHLTKWFMNEPRVDPVEHMLNPLGKSKLNNDTD